ncbi:hypothetical protein HanXRQr2_Chr16g0749441 [Helianthus annuus]|uniref:Uncharacterized protein n=1 Tax=Helianthus annuus TaxID=4232 RepID=A0A9K3DR52_HELAN|nr:hypothetical protein HanXRQr2_Chr16g0749441 [Helianthus annuus]KAJ0821294.1 hypothetical protein HanPSC8_Chr16g0718361 [Helianthus annuus]
MAFYSFKTFHIGISCRLTTFHVPRQQDKPTWLRLTTVQLPCHQFDPVNQVRLC